MYYYEFFLAVLVIFSNKLAAIYSKNRAEKRLKNPYESLPDLLHEYLPKTHLHTPDYVLLCVICYSMSKIKKFNVFTFHSLMYSLLTRPFFVCVTTLPTCVPKPIKKQSLYSKYFISTHDLMYSGHTSIFIFLGSILGGKLGWIIKYLFPILLITSRQHYTIDILVSHLIFLVYNKWEKVQKIKI